MTPLQELLIWVDEELKLDGYEHKKIMLKILKLREKEKKMITDAWNEGKLNEAGLSKILNVKQFYLEYSKKNSNESN